MTVPNGLKTFQEHIQSSDPRRQSIPYRKDHWQQWLGNDEDFAAVSRLHPHNVKRRDLVELTHTARRHGSTSAVRQLFLACMIWGHGTGNKGPWKVKRMLESYDADAKLQQAFGQVASGKVLQAYQSFRLDMCGPAYFTKYFQFVGLGHELSPCPFILDSQVAKSLKQLLGETLPYVAKLDGAGFVQWYPEGYMRYISMMSDWADELHCHPEQIEFFLFNPPSEFFV